MADQARKYQPGDILSLQRNWFDNDAGSNILVIGHAPDCSNYLTILLRSKKAYPYSLISNFIEDERLYMKVGSVDMRNIPFGSNNVLSLEGLIEFAAEDAWEKWKNPPDSSKLKSCPELKQYFK